MNAAYPKRKSTGTTEKDSLNISVGEFVKQYPYLTWKSDEPVFQIISNMREQDFYAGCVVNGGNLKGMVTEHKILDCMHACMTNPSQTVEKLSRAFNVYTARDVMISNPVTVYEDEPLMSAYEEIMDHGYRFIPVLKKSYKPVGILERDKLLRFLQETNKKELESKDMMLSYLMSHENYGGT